LRKWLRKVILSRLHTMEIRAIKIWDIPTIKQAAIKFRDKLREGFTSSAETEATPSINSDETEHGPIYNEEGLIVRTFDALR
jgi:hypothetical protein